MADKISSEKAKAIFDEKLKTDAVRDHVLSIIETYSDSVQFMEKIRKYASYEIEARIFKSWKFWGTTVGSAAISAIIGLMAARYFL